MPSDAHSLNYVESSIPEGMTLGEYRRQRMQRQPKPVRKGRAGSRCPACASPTRSRPALAPAAAPRTPPRLVRGVSR